MLMGTTVRDYDVDSSSVAPVVFLYVPTVSVTDFMNACIPWLLSSRYGVLVGIWAVGNDT